MKRFLTLMLAFSLASVLSAREHEDGGGMDGGGGDSMNRRHGDAGQPAQAPPQAPSHASPSQARQAAPTARRNNHAQALRRQPKGAAVSPQVRQPSRINLFRNNRNQAVTGRPAPQARPQNDRADAFQPNHGNVVHQPKYRQPDGGDKLRALGVTHVPEPIANRAHILDTSKAHSVIKLPTHLADGSPIHAQVVGAHDWNGSVVRTHMGLLGDHVRAEAFLHLNTVETQHNHYYWHHDGAGFDYCHYYDNWGYHWYGWYVGSRQFWTRYYADRWWFYDDAFGRWCFWNDGNWWWQDPYHVGDLYLYNDDQYIPSNSADGQVVSTVEPADAESFRSPDDTRVVKIMGDSKDAFLYDTAIPPAFNPLYLASKVDRVRFSDTSKGQPLQIMLKLSDGSTDLFDAQGVYVNFDGSSDAAPSGGGGPDDEPMTQPSPR